MVGDLLTDTVVTELHLGDTAPQSHGPDKPHIIGDAIIEEISDNVMDTQALSDYLGSVLEGASEDC